ncbi:MAG: lipopolysaccharide exporter, partial [Rhodothermales bacterium]
TREKAFGTLSAGVVGQRTVTTATQIGAGATTAVGAGGLLAGFGLGHLTAMLIYARHALKTLTLRGPINLREPARRYRRFAQFSSPAALVSALATRLPALVLLGVFGSEFLGWFGQAFNLLFVPLSLVGTAVGQVFFVEAAEARRRGSLHDETASIHALLASCAVVPLAGICAAAPEVFGFVFGAEWRTAGEYAIYLAPWIALSAIGSPLTRVFDVLEQQRRDLAVNLVMFSMVGGALIYISLYSGPLEGVLILGVAGAVSRAWQIAMALRSAGLSLVQSVRPYLRPAVEGALLFALMTFVRTTFSPGVTTLILALALIAWLPLLYRRTAAP